jgi:predicted nucleic acid-binding protein
MFLLDTNALSELRRRDRTDPRVAAWADGLQPSDLFLSVITIL